MSLLQRRTAGSFDWISFTIMLILCGLGLAFVWSATYKPELPYSLFFKKQAFGVISGILIYGIISLFDFRNLMRQGYFLYFCVIGLLIFTIIKGSIGMGAQRWINLGIIKIQPSELTKLLFPAFITYFLFAQQENFIYRFKDFYLILIILGLSGLLVIKQPDLGTALILAFSALVIMWLAGIDKRFFWYSALLVCVCTPALRYVLKPYQWQRIAVFLGQGDVHKERYQIEQAKIAIGSGGLWGKGFLQGTQNKLLFLPESRTDFIYAVICEETGLMGALGILMLYVLLFLHLFIALSRLTCPFSQLFGYGLVIHIMFSTFINIGMVVGLLPVVGIPLPFISYGVSNLWISFASLGAVQSIFRGRTHLIE
jgi:rod shape determining protein RodA